MSSSMGLTHRGRKILFAAVTEYIATGSPVGSRTLSRKYALDLSPATIRNVLADLEDAGFVHQPHTSAGRVPTERALRAFIEALVDFQEISQSDKHELRERFAEIFASDPTSDDVLRKTGLYLAELSGAAAIVARAPSDNRVLEHLRFIRTKPDQLLAVIVFKSGMVENRYIKVEASVDEAELERVHNLLADVVAGRTLGSLRSLFERRLDDERVRVDQLRQQAYALAKEAVGEAGDTSARTEVVIEGSAKLMDLPEYGDIDRLKRLMRALEDRAQLLGLINKTIDAGTVSVYIGSESGDELGEAQLSLVVAPYGERNDTGTVGVLGPTRMNYARIMPLVDASAAAITAALKKPDRS